MIQFFFRNVSERRVAQIVSQSRCLGSIRIETADGLDQLFIPVFSKELQRETPAYLCHL